jgi:protein-S-isoprenylcysteine O-methyltransferase Ste14
MSERAVYDWLIYGFYACTALTFPALLLLTAPYGRHGRDGWGPKVSNRVGWLIMEVPAAVVIAVCFLIARPPAVSWIFLAMWEIHYLHRAFVFPFRTRGPGKPMPFVIAFFGLMFNVINGYLNGRGLTVFHAGYTWAWLADPRFLVGVLLFVTGFAINFHSDQVLFNLRAPGETGYKIPRGGLYRWLSCPNYFGEIVEWSGFAIATWSPAGLAFVLWTAANLVPRARSNHRWYREKFADYPTERRAVFPLVF